MIRARLSYSGHVRHADIAEKIAHYPSVHVKVQNEAMRWTVGVGHCS